MAAHRITLWLDEVEFQALVDVANNVHRTGAAKLLVYLIGKEARACGRWPENYTHKGAANGNGNGNDHTTHA